MIEAVSRESVPVPSAPARRGGESGHLFLLPRGPASEAGLLRGLGKCPPKQARIDIGLAILGTKPLPRSGRSRTEIAAYCGCSRERIRQIEERALRRLRNRCIFLKDERLRQAGEELLGRSVPL